MKIPQNKINDVSYNYGTDSFDEDAFKAGIKFAEKELKKLGWDKLIKINNDPDKWLKVYKHYLELLTKEDVAGFWQEQFDLQVATKSDLAIEFAEWLAFNTKLIEKEFYYSGFYKNYSELFQQFLKDRNNE